MTGPPAEAFGVWLHSHEEDTGSATVYRPAGHPFPPSRGRSAVEIRPDGTYLEHDSGPDDRGRAVAVGRQQPAGHGLGHLVLHRPEREPDVVPAQVAETAERFRRLVRPDVLGRELVVAGEAELAGDPPDRPDGFAVVEDLTDQRQLQWPCCWVVKPFHSPSPWIWHRPTFPFLAAPSLRRPCECCLPPFCASWPDPQQPWSHLHLQGVS